MIQAPSLKRAVTAEVSRTENNSQYMCRVYVADRRMGAKLERPEIAPTETAMIYGNDVVIFNSTTGEMKPLKPRVVPEVVDSNRQELCEIVLDAAQASRSKAATAINRELAKIGYDGRIASQDVYKV